jgi:hypothetical protein
MSGLINNADSFFAAVPGLGAGESRDCVDGDAAAIGLDDVCFGEFSMISGIFIRCSSSSSGVKSSSILVHMLSSYMTRLFRFVSCTFALDG